MASASFTIHTTVPAPEQPGAPFLVLYDNGDWEFVPGAEVEHLNGIVMADNMASVLSEIALEYGEDEMDQVDGESLLDLDITFDSKGDDEAVLLFFFDGCYTPVPRHVADMGIEQEQAFNFIPLTDLFDEFKRYLKNNRAALYAYESEEPLDLGDFYEAE